ncbi:hypothetical protein [Methylomonas fluvii]|nr:hypothetical protein [Methylomonas fluvii]
MKQDNVQFKPLCKIARSLLSIRIWPRLCQNASFGIIWLRVY